MIDNLRLQLNETRDRLTELASEKQAEFKKLRERYEDQRRRESDQYAYEIEKMRQEIALA